MTTINETELEYFIIPNDLEIVRGYLKEVEKRSDYSGRNHKHVILEMLNHITKPLSAITMLDVKRYFEDVMDKKNTRVITKRAYRSYLNSFFYYVQAILLDQGITFHNPVPNTKVFKFTKHERDMKKVSEERKKIFSNIELIEILEAAKKREFRDFMIYSILTCTGMRLSECLTIKIENVNLKERFIETGLVKNARVVGNRV